MIGLEDHRLLGPRVGDECAEAQIEGGPRKPSHPRLGHDVAVPRGLAELGAYCLKLFLAPDVRILASLAGRARPRTSVLAAGLPGNERGNRHVQCDLILN